MTDPQPLPRPSSRERIGRGICDGCGEEGELTAFDVRGVAVGICICDPCMALVSEGEYHAASLAEVLR